MTWVVFIAILGVASKRISLSLVLHEALCIYTTELNGFTICGV